jgi:hypothetical protein
MNWNFEPKDHVYIFPIPDGTYTFNCLDAYPWPSLSAETGDEIGWLESLWKMEAQ